MYGKPPAPIRLLLARSSSRCCSTGRESLRYASFWLRQDPQTCLDLVWVPCHLEKQVKLVAADCSVLSQSNSRALATDCHAPKGCGRFSIAGQLPHVAVGTRSHMSQNPQVCMHSWLMTEAAFDTHGTHDLVNKKESAYHIMQFS